MTKMPLKEKDLKVMSKGFFVFSLISDHLKKNLIFE
jgi:hypothetical protein